MHNVLVLGAGNIGSLVGCLLADSGDYHVYLADIDPVTLSVNLPHLTIIHLDINEAKKSENFVRENKIQTLVSCLPYYQNSAVAELAKKMNLHYFDITEDVEIAKHVKKLAQNAKNVFVPCCGLAPGFVNIVANDLMQGFEKLDSVQLRVGNLPSSINNSLQYALSWSTDGLINEYGNVCYGIVDGKKMPLQPLEDLEVVDIDGRTYEAFNTSGGIGGLLDVYDGKVKTLNYKTLRYPGHCEKMRFLMKDMKLNDDRVTLKRILENVLPKTTQDVALIYVTITGSKKGQYMSDTYVNKIYPQQFLGKQWAAIQLTTASSVCAVLDMILNNLDHYHGFILQEQLPLKEFLQNRFGKVFAIK